MTPLELISKICKKCGQEKSLDEFGWLAKSKDGKNSSCRVCTNAKSLAWARANPEKRAAALSKYNLNNEERIRESKVRYYEANKEKVIKRAAQWKMENKQAVSVSSAARYLRQRDRILSMNRQWIKTNREKAIAACHRRRSAKLNAPGSHTAADVKLILKLQKHRCACCKNPLAKYHVDHVIPLSKGGTNDRFNLQILCIRCNHQKHAKDPIEFMQSKGYLL